MICTVRATQRTWRKWFGTPIEPLAWPQGSHFHRKPGGRSLFLSVPGSHDCQYGDEVGSQESGVGQGVKVESLAPDSLTTDSKLTRLPLAL
jgi:hypothetical protein